MNLKSVVKRLERELNQPERVIIYNSTHIEDDEPPGMIKVTDWSRPSWKEFITQEEIVRRLKENIKNGVQICGPNWEKWYDNEI